MSQVITATFDNGVLKPDQPLNLPAGSKVRLVVETMHPERALDDAWEEWDRLCDNVKLSPDTTRLTRDQLHERR